MAQKLNDERYPDYRGRMAGILLDSEVMQETDKLRGGIPRSKYINQALCEYNKRIAIMKQKMAELQEQEQKEGQLQKNEQTLGTLLQNSSTVGSHEERSAVVAEVGVSSSDVRASSCISHQTDSIQTRTPQGDIGGPAVD